MIYGPGRLLDRDSDML